MAPPLLSICIPTFNRLPYLRELVQVLALEIEGVNRAAPRVELVVSDNASPDATEPFLRALTWPWLSYHRNPTNVGPTENCILCVARASGKYVWLFGDDDLIEPGSLARVVECLERVRPVLLHLPSAESLVPPSSPTVYPSYGDCLRAETRQLPEFAMGQTLTTTNVFRKEIYRADVARTRETSSYSQMYCMLDGLCAPQPMAVLRGVVRLRPGDERAPFAEMQVALCVKLGRLLWHLATRFDVPVLRQVAIRLILHLPVDLAACCYRCVRPRRPRK